MSVASLGWQRGGPPTIRLGAERIVLELKMFFREPGQAFFTFSLPILFLVIFASIFDDQIDGPPGQEPVTFAQLFLPGIIAAGIVSTTFANLAMSVSVEQHEGLLKRLAGTPLPRASYFIGKIGMALTVSVIQTSLMLALGVAFYDLDLPVDPLHWAALAGVFFLGVSSCCLLGIAYTRLIPSAAAAAAIVQPPYLILQFISGVFIPYSEVPPWLQGVASIFPLRWMAQGLRYAFLPDWIADDQYGGDWQMGLVTLVLIGWTFLAFVLAFTFFRWSRTGR